MTKAKFVSEIRTIDPDTGGDVHLSVFKHENGGMFAIDSSYIEQNFNDDEDCFIPDPFEVYSPDNLYNSNDGIKLTGV